MPPSVQNRPLELQHWHAYKAGDQQALGKLMQQFSGTVNRWAQQNSSPNISPTALNLEAWKHVKHQIDTYDPERPGKKANLNTWVTWGLQKGKRFVQQQANDLRIPEPRASLVGIYKRAKEQFEEERGRPPTLDELYDMLAADHTLDPGRRKRFTRRTLAKLEREVVDNIPITDEVEEFIEDDGVTSDEVLARDLLYRSLTPRDQAIFASAFGYGGAKRLKNVEIAKLPHIKTSPTTVGKRIKYFKTRFQSMTV